MRYYGGEGTGVTTGSRKRVTPKRVTAAIQSNNPKSETQIENEMSDGVTGAKRPRKKKKAISTMLRGSSTLG